MTLSHCTRGLATAVLLTATAMSGARAQQVDTSLAPGRARALEVGMPLDSALRAAGRATRRRIDLLSEGQLTQGMEIDLPGGPRPSIVALIGERPCGRLAIAGIYVFDPRFRTSSGVGVGSSLAELRRAHEVRLNREEGHSVIVPALRMAFGIDGTSFADSVRATSVYLTLHPDSIRARWCPARQ